MRRKRPGPSSTGRAVIGKIAGTVAPRQRQVSMFGDDARSRCSCRFAPVLRGTLLAESLRTGADVRVPGLRLTRVERQDVSAFVPAAQPPIRTFLDFEADDVVADELAQSLAGALLIEGGWYADFTVGDEHVVVFAGAVFRYRRGDLAGRARAVEYGQAAGVANPAEHLGADRFRNL